MGAALVSIVWVVLLNWALVVPASEATLRICNLTDFSYVYTQCDSEGGRWRVSVPKSNTCAGGSPPPPVRGKQCDFTCHPGEYLDINTDQECRKCPAGQYSLGGGVLFNNWATLPAGFTTRLDQFVFSAATESTCNTEGWLARGRYLIADNSECVASLIYTAVLVQPGDLEFEYQHPFDDMNTIFNVEITNSQCQSNTEPFYDQYLRHTAPSEWKTTIVSLKTGINTINWHVYGIGSDSSSRLNTAVTIRSIKITGVAYTSQCTQCEPGSYSAAGAFQCERCLANSYSSLGASVCTPCDTRTQYSDPGSPECKTRPLCTVNHYVSFHSPCVNGKTRKVHDWIEPKLCMNGVSLPPPGELEDCPTCNVGMQMVNGTCHFCSPNEHSSGSNCTACPGSTSPEYGVVFKQWSHLPPNSNISTMCLSLSEGSLGCVAKEAWYPAAEYIETAHINSDDVYMVLNLDIGGFRGSDDMYTYNNVENAMSIAEILFQFEMSCTDDCELIFLSQYSNDATRYIQRWNGTQKRTTYRHVIKTPGAIKFSWAFQKSNRVDDFGRTFMLTADFARVYLINVTNTVTGGAETCKHCPRGINNNGCIPCSEGEYIEPETGSCTRCPSNTVVMSSNPWGIESCVKCGEGLTPYKGRQCVSTCQYVNNNGTKYDFSPLSSINVVVGPRLFTATGHAYMHVFNVSLCGGIDNRTLAMCVSNMSSTAENFNTVSNVTNFVCQSTILLSENPDDPVVSVSPISLGDKLVRVTSDADRNITALLNETGFLPSTPADKNSTQDVYMMYTSDSPTVVCRRGRSVLIVLRCPPDHDQSSSGGFELPPRCADGTCDGCNFILLVKSISACPVCTSDDFDSYKTACVNGQRQTITSMKRRCNPSNLTGLPEMGTKNEECSLLWQSDWPIWLKVIVILVPVILMSGMVLVPIVIYCWCRNRSLEYKYMKLVQSANSGGKYSELPAAETCALDEDEEDEDHFDATKIRKGHNILSKFKMQSNDKEDEETFESVRMSKKSLLT